ncbi:hypothetical protein LY78DRAFT_388321 [Colletotrichum sublineola]|nr:hypothetical protein LY78DRAFT_388321 [Colletotrichum sublineola]
MYDVHDQISPYHAYPCAASKWPPGLLTSANGSNTGEASPIPQRRHFSSPLISTRRLRMFPRQSRKRATLGSDYHRKIQNVIFGKMLGQTTPYLRVSCKRYHALVWSRESAEKKNAAARSPTWAHHHARARARTPTREQSLEPQGQSNSAPARCASRPPYPGMFVLQASGLPGSLHWRRSLEMRAKSLLPRPFFSSSPLEHQTKILDDDVSVEFRQTDVGGQTKNPQ